MDWFPWYPTDFKRDTYHLTLAEDGAYRRLIDEYMITRKPLPNNDHALARILGIGIDEWMKIHATVISFFRVNDGKLRHKRCDRELAAQDRRQERFSERGKKAAFAKYSKINGQGPRRMLLPPTLHNKDNTLTQNTPPREAPAEPPKEGRRGEIPITSELASLMQAKLRRA